MIIGWASIPGGGFSPLTRGNEGGTTTQRGAARRDATGVAFPWLWITSPEPHRTEFPDLCGTWYPCEGSWNQDILRQKPNGRTGEPPPRRVVLVDVDSRTPSPSIERTSLFPPFSYIGSAAVITQSIVCATRDAIIGVDLSRRRTLRLTFCLDKNFRVVQQSFT